MHPTGSIDDSRGEQSRESNRIFEIFGQVHDTQVHLSVTRVPIFVATDGGFASLSLDVPEYPEYLAKLTHSRCIPGFP